MNDLHTVSMAPSTEEEEWITYDAADDQEPDNHVNSFCNLLGVLPNLTVDSNLVQEFPANGQVEYGPDANRSEKTNKGRLEFVLDLMDIFVHRKDDWQSTNQEDQNSQEDETIDGNDIVVDK